MFGCQYVCSNVLTCDEFLDANGHYMARLCVCHCLNIE